MTMFGASSGPFLLAASVEDLERENGHFYLLHKCPFSSRNGSPGQTRTADQVVTSALIFLPGLDYLITRPKTGLRVSGASPPISLGEYELKL